MANKKAASTAKKSTTKSTSAKKPTTKVTTVKAVESKPTERAAAVRSNSSFVARFNSMPLLAAAIAEFVGTFLLAAAVLTLQNQPIQLWFGVIGIILVIAGLSGAHLNPIVSVAAWVTRRITWVRALGYIVAQVLGAILALTVLSAFINQAPEVSQQAAMFGQSAPQLFTATPVPQGKEWTVLFAELLGAIILGFAYASALRGVIRDKVSAALTISSGYFLALVIGGSAAGVIGATGIFNPAAAIALQALSWNVWPIAIYIVTSIIGGILGFLLFDLLRQAERDVA